MYNFNAGDYMTDLQNHIQTLIQNAVDTGRENGIQVAVYRKGKLVVDAWAGSADPAANLPVNGDTLFPVFSCSKAVAATVIHILAERGLLDYDAPIARYWPEFAQNGKAEITLRHALAHTAGLPQMPEGVGLKEIGQWDVMCDAVSRMKPISKPGERQEYHAISFSWLVGEVACRVTGISFPQLIEEEICRPLKRNDIFIGLPNDIATPVAILSEPDVKPMLPGPSGADSVPAWIQPLHEWMNLDDARRGCIPASNGIMSARGLAAHYAALLPDGLNGIRLISPERLAIATEKQIPWGQQEEYASRGLGYALGDAFSATRFGHGGYGGSNGLADPVTGLAVGITKNLYSAQGIHEELIATIRANVQ